MLEASTVTTITCRNIENFRNKIFKEKKLVKETRESLGILRII
jgi:hypothetical protein